MKLAESLRIAIRSLSVNKMRSSLTMLGIIIGVGAVITLLSVGQGVQRLVTEQIQSVGSNLLFVVPGVLGGGGGQGSTLTLTVDDAQAIADPRNIPDVAAVAPTRSIQGQVEYANRNKFFSVSGVTPEFSPVRNTKVTVGRFLEPADLTARSRVAVLGADVYDTLFPNGGYPIGQTIKINRIPFRVIGLMERKGGGPFGSEDDYVWVPLTTLQTRLVNTRSREGDPLVTVIYVSVREESRMVAAQDDITRLLRERHKIAPGDDDDFSVINQADLLAVFGQITGVLTLFLGAIAGISLLVGGIGIMNIMLVSVTERTREIGIRKAVGAKRRDILLQFLIEAIVLSVIGGLIGIALGWAGALAIKSVSSDIQTYVSPGSILLATSFSLAVGLFFGIYPAFQASRLNPIEALRYE
ncbi:MAG: ABC transporter permease [Ardenticatenaceae bacterium]|nr:ABC transporter permease [Ardenticatenaceae bacterium]HBY98656.1 hypothetical protein [Chloroflexota bacterium]